MTFFGGIQRLLLGPIELLFDVVYSLAHQILKNPVYAIFALSLFVNILVLPLYQKADALQREEQEITKRLKPRIDRIKKAFSGEERFMMLQTYYRQNHYQPYYALRSSLPLLLQIPFFMAAYNFLSGLQIIVGVSWGPIRDLGQPDGMIQIAGITVNVLPVLMTVINLVSGAVYTRGQPWKNKIQLYAMALVFLVLLYNSPAGLVIYWTLNNLFSLCKNIFAKLKHPGAVLRIGCSAAGLFLAAVALFRLSPSLTDRRIHWLYVAAAVLQLPLLWGGFRKRHPAGEVPPEKSRQHRAVFFVCCLLMTVLTGVLIPSAVISSSPAEFVQAGHYQSPLRLIGSSFLLAAGTFLIWVVLYYGMASAKARSCWSLVMALLSAVGITDYLFFGNHYGDMNSHLQYGRELAVSRQEILINLLVLAAVAGIIVLLWTKKNEAVKAVCIGGCLAVIGTSVVNLSSIGSRLPEIEKTAMQENTLAGEKIIHLDRHEKNVVVLMLDRAIGPLVPYLFQEHAELQEQFSGFTWYPNTISYGPSTNTGTPALYGGYDYVPEKLDARTDMLLKDKQNEALKIMPVNFLRAGYEVTVCDPPYANYQWIPDLSIYDDYPEIRRFNTEGRISGNLEEVLARSEKIWNRNLFCYSLFRCAPVMLHSEMYDFGYYYDSEGEQHHASMSVSVGYNDEFLNAYQVLEKLSDITEIRDSGTGCFLMMANTTTHNEALLQEPAYEPAARVDNRAYDAEHPVRYAMDGREMVLADLNQARHYQMNMAAYLKVGAWLDTLREQGVYDNTRIIIVADHGWDMGFSGDNDTARAFSFSVYNPVLMVKDFDSREPFRTDGRFMTNAETPTLAFREIVKDPFNPFLNREITDQDRNKREHRICNANWHIDGNGYTFDGSYMTYINPEAAAAP